MTRTLSMLIAIALAAVCATLAASLQPLALNQASGEQGRDLLSMLTGEGRQMFARQFFVKADVYFHRGFYPTVFDQGRGATADAKNMLAEANESDEKAHEEAMSFMGAPRDIFDRFGRHFYPSTHSHLDGPGEAREILPWLKISSELDPQRVETYIVASFMLRKNMDRSDEAEKFLREGLRANPGNYELLNELGRIYADDRHDTNHAQALWESAARHWRREDFADKKPNPIIYDAVLSRLAHIAEDKGEYQKAVDYLKEEVKVAPQPDVIQKQLEEMKLKAAGPSGR